ncbi:hypothetical protein M9H77_33053 [Catharanthus roseus]|uniref:Uncharacterized protein n=1 Tax=Catharanthus roseus TaxID=4058 RepID=A0ACC0A5J2_CATRO|nr:hypothetical protein M9H77_33053 [Catharanthus roseus]
MKCFLNFFIVIFFLILLSRSHDALPSSHRMKKDVALINEACKKSKDFDLCLSILKRDPNSGKTNIECLAIIVLEYAIEKTKETIKLVNKLGANTTDKVLKVCFEGCATEYGSDLSVIYHCQTSINAIKKKDYEFAQANIEWALENESSCENCFSEFEHPHKSPITRENNFNSRILLIAAYILPAAKL